MALAAGLDRLLGDPRPWPHPVVAMGWLIARLRAGAEALAGDRPGALRLAGTVITLVLVGGSALTGRCIEQLALGWPLAGGVLLVAGLASALAGRSLRLEVEAVQRVLPIQADGDLTAARGRLAWIVGRDTDRLDQGGILRALAETASENAVDGQLAPLFWMLVGAALWCSAPGLPGPLALAWAYKASSTLDSMLGYRRGRLRWLGTAGARLDDGLTWLPSRLTALCLGQWRNARRDGRPDPSPNAGVSQAAYAHAVGVCLGGLNHYRGEARRKPLLNRQGRPAEASDVAAILALTGRVSLAWLGATGVAAAGLQAWWMLRPQ
ncbi:MAG: adenosylcobinamide-phosphate synthase CbiB [Prochlorococcaceae cyanobacterium]